MKRFSLVKSRRNKVLGFFIALFLGISVCAYAEEAGDMSVFEEKGSKMDVLEESKFLRKQLETMLSGNKKAAKAYESYMAESKKNEKPKAKAEPKVKPVIGEPDVIKAEHLGLAKPADEKAVHAYKNDAQKAVASSVASDKVNVTPNVSEDISKDNSSIGKRFLERYYAATGRTYSDTTRQVDKIIKDTPDSSKKASSEAFTSDKTSNMGKQFLERYKAENEPREPLIMTDPALSDYPERSLDCQYLDYEGGAASVIYVKPGYKTDILLPAGDKLSRITVGDRQRFDISTYYDKSESRWHVYVQPYQYDITTNIIIATDRHTFQAKFETTMLLKPYVRWNVPDDNSAGYKERNVVMDVESVKDLNFRYDHSGKINPDYAPMNVFDDKHWHTYLSFEKNVLSAINPVILAKNEDGSMVIVPYEKRGDIIVMNKVYKEFEVRTGNHIVNYVRAAR